MSALDPRLVDLALAAIALEGVALILWRRMRGAGPRPTALLANLAAGALLLVVARDGLIGAGAFWTGAALTGALFAHGLDLAARWERKR